jgi:hypothetical protein
MLTDPNPPNRLADDRSVGAMETPAIALDATTFRQFVTASWGRPRPVNRARAEHRASMAPAPDVLGALRQKSFG